MDFAGVFTVVARHGTTVCAVEMPMKLTSFFQKKDRGAPGAKVDPVRALHADGLRSADAILHVQAARESAPMTALRDDLAKALSGRRCIVIGSAPNSRIVQPGASDRVICVNGSGWAAKAAGIVNPDLTIMAGHSLRGNTEVREATVSAMHGARTAHLLLLEAGVSMADAITALDEAEMRYDELSTVNSVERAAIIGQAWGQEIPLGPRTTKNDRPSNGIFAASIAVWAGASEVILCGFSLSGGHAYIDGDTPREHIGGDRNFFSLARRLNCRIRTTSDALNAEFQLTPA